MAPILTKQPELSVGRHDRDVVGMTYVYPVVSRRAGGVSVGVNLNPNQACSWRCVYCQVPGLVRGSGPEVDLPLLRTELGDLLSDIVHGDFMERAVPKGARRLSDVALSGNGEPTTSPQFFEVVEVVGEVLTELDLLGSVKLVLITNGSQLGRARVLAGVQRMAEFGGEVWFKLDTATAGGLRLTNDASVSPDVHLQRLREVAQICPTLIQTCMFRRRGEPPSEAEVDAYLCAVGQLVRDQTGVRGVLLYSLARPSQQPEAPELEALDRGWLDQLARRIEAVGMSVRVS